VEELLGEGGSFDLKTYFDSYMKIRGNFAWRLELILCTNIGLKFGPDSNIPRLLESSTTGYQNVNLYFEPTSGCDDILRGERFRLVSRRYGKERENVVRGLSAYFGAKATDVEEFIDRLVFAV